MSNAMLSYRPNRAKLPAKIIGIQFGIPSPDEIRKGSVVEITSRDTYANNKPVIGGLFDPRMGVLEPGLICPTDGLDYMQTPGYFGHLELARPVYYIQYLATIQNLLQCVCFKCSKLLISKDKYAHLLALPSQQRWRIAYELCKVVKRCGAVTEDGCGCLQPEKIKKEGLASLSAEWKPRTEKGSSGGGAAANKAKSVVLPLTPEMVLRIFQRISDEDVTFLGFSPIWSRPEWMICQVLAVPPPAMRPSVKHDAQQRSEDDISHILVNIIKTNKVLLEKMQAQQGSGSTSETIVNDWTVILQYYVASMVDNKMSGASPVAQKSGRPFKSIKDRLNGKGGRMRGNLMAKRVDFSARSVITADPNISIRELGVPLKIAKTLTKPVLVNARNRDFLMKLVRNGPDVWPGAKILQRRSGESVTLRYLDRNSIVLEDGDIVHRHMMSGDPVIFNRQPTLHKMSMMCHIARVMQRGDTFRMNVADTKPYNADFDGDEMNLHMPQSVESEAELFGLAAVPFQIISPANNAPIIGIYQDSMVGAFRFTREGISFTTKDAMNLLMSFPRVNPAALLHPDGEEGGDGGKGSKADRAAQRVSNFAILSQIMPPITLKMKNKMFNGDQEKVATSNNVIEIVNGQFVRGQIDKGILGSGTKGIIHRVCNDFGNMAASDFIDHFQDIITKYMEQSAFSVGISDLNTDEATNNAIVEIIASKKADVKNLIDQVQMGIFENNSGKTMEEEFETRVNNVLSKAQNEAGRKALNALSKDNRFVVMFNAGSKGSELNIQQMTACLGQQNVDGRRIPYGFENRTLPHYSKYDDSAAARGFVESSYINGLTPQELFFHAMGGRIGLIDTAVKTSTTGYLQRRFVKALENLMVSYDMTVRTSKRTIVQFTYGDDSFDTVKVENQDLPIVEMSVQDIYGHFCLLEEEQKTKYLSVLFDKDAYKRQRNKDNQKALVERCKQSVDFLLKMRPLLVENVFGGKSDKTVRVPVAFAHVIQNVIGQQNIGRNSIVDLTLLEAYGMIDAAYAQLERMVYTPPNDMFKSLWTYYLSPKDLLVNKRLNRKSLEVLLATLLLDYKRALVAPGEMVGIIAAQSIGEPTTQMTLNTFHFAGVASKSNVTRGVPRIEEIMSLSKSIKNPSLTIYLKPEEQSDREKASSIQYMIEHTRLRDIVQSVAICFDPDDLSTLIEEDRELIAQYREFEQMVGACASAATSAMEVVNEYDSVEAEIAASEAAAAEAAEAAGDADWVPGEEFDEENESVASMYRGGGGGRRKHATTTAVQRGGATTYQLVSGSGSSNNPDTKSKWVVRLEMDLETMLEKNITMDDVHFALANAHGDSVSCIYSDYNADKLVFRVRINQFMTTAAAKKKTPAYADFVHTFKEFQDRLLDDIVLRGVKNINKVILRKLKDVLVEQAGAYKKEDGWVLDTIGTNLMEVLGLDYIDATRTVSNDILEIYNVLGVEAARRCIYSELAEVLEFDGSYVNSHHMALMCDRMCFKNKLISIFRHGLNADTDVGPIAKASFEETPDMFLRAAQHGELDLMTGISANVMTGQMGNFGTSAFQVLAAQTMLEVNEKTTTPQQQRTMSTQAAIAEGLFSGMEADTKGACGAAQLKIENQVANVKAVELGDADNAYDPFA